MRAEMGAVGLLGVGLVVMIAIGGGHIVTCKSF
ncbi:hypothetical protein IBTHAUMO2_90001 [Nitrosopumilaceae archaeon]|nr:hypothetical protein IBTHAUMO2_90001 [Nitrosopumilaceae archaeon]